LENLQIRVGSAITRAPAARLIRAAVAAAKCSREHDPGKWVPVFGKDHAQMQKHDPGKWTPVFGKDHAQMQIKHAKSSAIVTVASAGFASGADQESKMPKMKTKSGAKKRFKVTGSGKVLYQQSRKRHGMIKRTKKQIRQLRGTNVLFKTDGDNVKKYFLPNG